MTWGSLEGPAAKLKRAELHYHYARDTLSGGKMFHERPVRTESDREGLEYRFYVGEIEPLDVSWPLVIGDCLFNLRAALDYLVYELHVREYKGKVPNAKPDDAVHDSAWPVVVVQPSKRGLTKDDRVRRLDTRERTTIEWLQPYHRRNDDLSAVRQILPMIHDLNIIDKHRQLHVVRSFVAGVPVVHPPAKYGFQNDPKFGVTLKSNAHIDTWTFALRPPVEYVQAYAFVIEAVTFESGGFNWKVLENMVGWIAAVRTVLGRFAGRFPPLADPHLLDHPSA